MLTSAMLVFSLRFIHFCAGALPVYVVVGVASREPQAQCFGCVFVFTAP